MSLIFPVRLTPGWGLFTAQLPRGAVKTGLALDGCLSQFTPIDFYDDNSWRLALGVSRATVAGSYGFLYDPPTVAAAPWVPVWPNASAVFTHGGLIFKAVLPEFNPDQHVDTWRYGPLATERSVNVTPLGPDAKPHALIQVVFDVCSFNDGSSRVRVTVTNSRDVVNDASVDMEGLTITVGSSVIYYGPQKVWQGQAPNWTGTTGGFLLARVHLDKEMLYQSGYHHRIDPNVSSPTTYINDDASCQQGNFNGMSYSQSAPGGRNELGPDTTAQAECIAHGGDNPQDHVFMQAGLAGSWCGHLRGPDGTKLMSLIDDPHYTPKSYAGFHQYYELNFPHLPPLNYAAFLMRGDRFDSRMMRSWASVGAIQIYDVPRQNTDEYASDVSYEYRKTSNGMVCNLMANYAAEPRGFGRLLRAWIDAWLATPAKDVADKAYFWRLITENIANLDAYAKRPGGGFFNFPFWEFDPGVAGGYGGVHQDNCSIAYWQIMELVAALLHAIQAGFPSDKAFITRVCGSYLALFKAAPKSQWGYLAAVYYLRVGRHVWKGDHQIFNTWPEIFAANWGTAPPGGWDPQDNGGQMGAPYYRMPYRFLLQVAAWLGLAGTEEPLAFFALGPGEAALNPSYAFGDLAGGLGIAEPPPVVVVPPVVVPPATIDQVVGKVTLKSRILSLTETDPDLTDNAVETTVDVLAAVPVPPLPPAVPKTANVKITQTPLDPVRIGSTYRVLYKMTNAGPDDATNQHAELDVPPGATFVRASPSYGQTSNAGGNPQWLVDKLLAKGDGVTCTVTYQAVSLAS